MLDTNTIKLIEEKIKLIEAEGFGEVIIESENGRTWRVTRSIDTIIDELQLEEKIKLLDGEGISKVIIKVKNGRAWRVISSIIDELPLDKDIMKVV